jgi:hypothetical protein
MPKWRFGFAWILIAWNELDLDQIVFGGTMLFFDSAPERESA